MPPAGESPEATPTAGSKVDTARPASPTQAALALSIPLLAALGGGVAAALADALDLRSADSRFAAVGLGLAIPLLVGYLLRPDAERRGLAGLLSLPWLAVLVAPRSSLAGSWLSGGVLFLGLTAVAWAGQSAWRLGTTTPSKVGLATLAVLPGVYLWSATAVVLVNTQLVLVPVRIVHQNPRVDADERLVALHTVDGYTLEATYTQGRRGAPGVVLNHGVSDGRDRWLPWVDRLRREGVHVLRFDLRAHGRSEGTICTYGQREMADLRSGVEWLRERDDVSEVAVVGASMGGGVVLAASRDLDVPAAVVLAPASDYRALVARRIAFLGPIGPPILSGSARLASAMGQEPMTDWRPRERMSRTLPILAFHGTRDGTIPLALSQRLARDRPNVELHELPGVEHNEIPARVAADEWPTVWAFLEAHFRAPLVRLP